MASSSETISSDTLPLQKIIKPFEEKTIELLPIEICIIILEKYVGSWTLNSEEKTYNNHLTDLYFFFVCYPNTFNKILHYNVVYSNRLKAAIIKIFSVVWPHFQPTNDMQRPLFDIMKNFIYSTESKEEKRCWVNRKLINGIFNKACREKEIDTTIALFEKYIDLLNPMKETGLFSYNMFPDVIYWMLESSRLDALKMIFPHPKIRNIFEENVNGSPGHIPNLERDQTRNFYITVFIEVAMQTKNINILKCFFNIFNIDPSHNNYLAVCLAAEQGELCFLSYMIKTYEINPNDIRNGYPFIIACEKGYLDMVNYLLTYPDIDVSKLDNYALRAACLHGHLEVVEKLSTIDRVDLAADNNYPIRIASKNGHEKLVRFLLSIPKVNVKALDDYAIKAASINGYLNIIKLLVELGHADPAAENNLPVRMAAAYGHLKVTKYLCSLASVDPSDLDNYALEVAGLNNHLKVRDFLSIQPSIQAKKKKIAKKEIAYQILPKIQDSKEREHFKKLCNAVYQKDLQKLKELLEIHMDNSHSTNYHNSVFYLSCLKENFDMIQYLINSNKIDLQYYNLAIKIFSENGNYNLVKLLLTFPNVDVTCEDNYPIRKASENGHIKIVKLLIAVTKADPSAQNNYAIRKASLNGHLQVVKTLLLDGRVDPTALNNYALQAARHKGHKSIINLLLSIPAVGKKSNEIENSRLQKYNFFVAEERFFSRIGNSKELIQESAKIGDIDTLKHLFRIPGYDTKEINHLLLEISCRYNQTQIFNYLLNKPIIDLVNLQKEKEEPFYLVNTFIEILRLLGRLPEFDLGKNIDRTMVDVVKCGSLENLKYLCAHPKGNYLTITKSLFLTALGYGDREKSRFLLEQPEIRLYGGIRTVFSIKLVFSSCIEGSFSEEVKDFDLMEKILDHPEVQQYKKSLMIVEYFFNKEGSFKKAKKMKEDKALLLMRKFFEDDAFCRGLKSSILFS